MINTGPGMDAISMTEATSSLESSIAALSRIRRIPFKQEEEEGEK
jgi:hypothetical protein